MPYVAFNLHYTSTIICDPALCKIELLEKGKSIERLRRKATGLSSD